MARLPKPRKKTTCGRPGCDKPKHGNDHYCQGCRKEYNRTYHRNKRTPNIEAP